MRQNRLLAGKWWKFDRYRISETGFIRQSLHILPGVGAKLTEYDPWAHWGRDRRVVGQSIESPYRRFLDMVGRLRCKTQTVKRLSEIPSHSWADHSEQLTKDSKATIVQWCQEHGLLGLMPHSISQVILAPHVEKFPRWGAITYKRAGHQPPSTIQWQVQYARTSRGWRESRLPTTSRRTIEPGVLTERGTYESLQRLAHFFPKVPSPVISEKWKTRRYPLPLTPEFWAEYGESLADFLFAAHKLRMSVDAMALKKASRSRQDEQRSFALEVFLDPLLNPIGLTYGLQSGAGVVPRFYAGSLLAAFAAMAVEDVPKGQIKRCPICGSPFIAGAHQQALYCSKRCRWTAQRRAYRKRKRADEIEID